MLRCLPCCVCSSPWWFVGLTCDCLLRGRRRKKRGWAGWRGVEGGREREGSVVPSEPLISLAFACCLCC